MTEGYPDFEDGDQKFLLSSYLRKSQWQMVASILYTYFGPAFNMSRELAKEISTQMGFEPRRVPGAAKDEVYIVVSEWTADQSEYRVIDGVFFDYSSAMKKSEEVKARMVWAKDFKVTCDKFRVEA